jgi:hypothetical protein
VRTKFDIYISLNVKVVWSALGGGMVTVVLKLIVISLLSELIEVESPGSYIGRKFPTTGRYLEIFILHIGIGVRFHVSGVL